MLSAKVEDFKCTAVTEHAKQDTGSNLPHRRNREPPRAAKI